MIWDAMALMWRRRNDFICYLFDLCRVLYVPLYWDSVEIRQS